MSKELSHFRGPYANVQATRLKACGVVCGRSLQLRNASTACKAVGATDMNVIDIRTRRPQAAQHYALFSEPGLRRPTKPTDIVDLVAVVSPDVARCILPLASALREESREVWESSPGVVVHFPSGAPYHEKSDIPAVDLSPDPGGAGWCLEAIITRECATRLISELRRFGVVEQMAS